MCVCCCTNIPTSIRGSLYAPTSSKALLEAFSDYMKSLSATHDLLVTERESGSISDELWEMRFRQIEENLDSSISNIRVLVECEKLLIRHFKSPATVKKQKKTDLFYHKLNFSEFDRAAEKRGSHMKGEIKLKGEVQQALLKKGDLGGHEIIYKYCIKLLPAARKYAQRLSKVKKTKKWVDNIIDPTVGMNEAASALMGKFLELKVAHSYFAAYYLQNVRMEKGFLKKSKTRLHIN